MIFYLIRKIFYCIFSNLNSTRHTIIIHSNNNLATFLVGKSTKRDYPLLPFRKRRFQFDFFRFSSLHKALYFLIYSSAWDAIQVLTLFSILPLLQEKPKKGYRDAKSGAPDPHPTPASAGLSLSQRERRKMKMGTAKQEVRGRKMLCLSDRFGERESAFHLLPFSGKRGHGNRFEEISVALFECLLLTPFPAVFSHHSIAFHIG